MLDGIREIFPQTCETLVSQQVNSNAVKFLENELFEALIQINGSTRCARPNCTLFYLEGIEVENLVGDEILGVSLSRMA